MSTSETALRFKNYLIHYTGKEFGNITITSDIIALNPKDAKNKFKEKFKDKITDLNIVKVEYLLDIVEEDKNKISAGKPIKDFFEEYITNNIPDTLKEIDEEIELKKKKLKLAKLDKAIFKNHIIKINGVPYFGRDLSYGATKIEDIENEIGKNPPPTPRRDTNYYKNKFERKKHSYNLEDALMIVFISIFGSVMITLIIMGR